MLVWLHGGAYIAGSSEEQAYNGSLLSEEGDLVVVTVSYRLGIFGYLYDPDQGIVKLNWKPDDSPLGACHCLELSLLFGSWSRWQGVPMLGSTTKAEWERRSSDFRRQWAVFIRKE